MRYWMKVEGNNFSCYCATYLVMVQCLLSIKLPLGCVSQNTHSSLFLQVLLWALLWHNPNPSMIVLSKLFIAGLSFSAALGFLLYGGR